MTKLTLEIEGPQRVVENVYHELVKETQNAKRYGHNVSVQRVGSVETDESTEFRTANE